MPNCESLLVTEAERKHARRRTRFQQHRDVSSHQVFFLQGKVAIFRLTRSSLLQRRPGWTDNLLNFFLSGLQKLEQRAKEFIELRGEYAE